MYADFTACKGIKLWSKMTWQGPFLPRLPVLAVKIYLE